MPTNRKTSKRVASKAGTILGLTKREFNMEFSKWLRRWPHGRSVNIIDVRDWAWRYLSRRARSVAGSAMSQRSGK